MKTAWTLQVLYWPAALLGWASLVWPGLHDAFNMFFLCGLCASMPLGFVAMGQMGRSGAWFGLLLPIVGLFLPVGLSLAGVDPSERYYALAILICAGMWLPIQQFLSALGATGRLTLLMLLSCSLTTTGMVVGLLRPGGWAILGLSLGALVGVVLLGLMTASLREYSLRRSQRGRG